MSCMPPVGRSEFMLKILLRFAMWLLVQQKKPLWAFSSPRTVNRKSSSTNVSASCHYTGILRQFRAPLGTVCMLSWLWTWRMESTCARSANHSVTLWYPLFPWSPANSTSMTTLMYYTTDITHWHFLPQVFLQVWKLSQKKFNNFWIYTLNWT